MTKFLYYRKKVRHKISSYNNSVYLSLQRKWLFWWVTFDRRKFTVKTDKFGEKWCMEFIDNTKEGKIGMWFKVTKDADLRKMAEEIWLNSPYAAWF